MSNTMDARKDMNVEYFPDNTPIDEWFYRCEEPNLSDLGTAYLLTDFGVSANGRMQTKRIQKLINLVYKNGGGVIVVPKGVFMTGALFFKQGVHLYLQKGAVLKGSDDINDYKLLKTRIEGETCLYYSALINAEKVDGFVIAGEGVIDGNGKRAWRSFWERRKWNPAATNKDEQRARLVYISNSSNVTLHGVTFQNAQFWTTHIYKCHHVKYLKCKFFSPRFPINAPSTDAIDIDVCSDVLVKNCDIYANDDAIALKGGKGPTAHKSRENGKNERILIEDNLYRFAHSCLTCGSETIHNRNILCRNGKIELAFQLLNLKLRADTVQHNEYIKVENMEGKVVNFLSALAWKQFENKNGTCLPTSICEKISFDGCKINCKKFLNVKMETPRYCVRDFQFKNLDIVCENVGCGVEEIDRSKQENITIQVEKFIQE